MATEAFASARPALRGHGPPARIEGGGTECFAGQGVVDRFRDAQDRVSLCHEDRMPETVRLLRRRGSGRRPSQRSSSPAR